MRLSLLGRVAANIYCTTSPQQRTIEYAYGTLALEQTSQTLESEPVSRCPVGLEILRQSSTKVAEYAQLLLECGKARDFSEGRRVHEQLKQTDSELEHESSIGNILISMYGKCGKPKEAQEAFDRIHKPNVSSWSSMISVYASEPGRFDECMGLYHRMQQQGVCPNNVTFVSLLKAFDSRSQLLVGKCIHGHVAESGYESNSMVGTTLMNMYGKCGSLEDAKRVFERLELRRPASWSVLIACYASDGAFREAVRILYTMISEGVMPDKITFINVVAACRGPEFRMDANRIHSCISQHESRYDVILGNAVLNMFGKCGVCVVRSREFFDEMVGRATTASWNTMIGIYIQDGKQGDALGTFRRMLLDGGSLPDKVTFSRVFSVCGDFQTLEAFIFCMVEAGIESDIVIDTVLVNAYTEFGELERARQVFNSMPDKDCVLWNVMITASEDFSVNYQLFQEMLLAGTAPNRFTFVSLFDSYAGSAPDDNKHKTVLLCAKESGLHGDLLVSNAVISTHGKAGRLYQAEESFANCRRRDVVSWNATIGAFADNGCLKQALILFKRMLLEGEKVNRITLTSVLATCTGIREARRIHELVKESGFEFNIQVGNSLISMYARCSGLEDAEIVFQRMQKQDVVSWTALLAAYEEDPDRVFEAARCFRVMLLQGVVPSRVTLMTMLSIFSREEALAEGKFIHLLVEELGLGTDLSMASSLIDMYGECGSPEEAAAVFEKSGERDVVLWNAMITAYARGVSLPREVLRLFQMMLHEGMKPSRITFAALLDVFTEAGALHEGRLVHKFVREAGMDTETSVGTGLVSLYGKCGKLEESSRAFEWMREQNSTSWNTLMMAHAARGDVDRVMELFHNMQQEGLEVNNATFVSILSSCSHAGELDTACRCYRDMEHDFFVVPTSGEKGCLVDLFGRTGRLKEAEEFVGSLSEDEAVMWSTLAGSCDVHGESEMGSRAAQRLVDLEPHMSCAYVILSNNMRRC